MAKSASDNVLDAPANYIIGVVDRMIVCSAQPTTYAEANTTYELADVAVAGGDFTKANGDTSGRKVTVAAKNGVAVDVTGTATHVALVDDGASELLWVTTCPSQGVSSGGTVDIGSWKIEFGDPT